MDIGLYYLFTRQDSGNSVQVKRGTDAPQMMGFGGRWDVVARPRNRSMTLWNGDDPFTMDVPILCDGFDTGRSMEDAISILNQMRASPSPFTPPPVVTIDGALPVKGGSWVITGIDWGSNVLWHSNGYRLRQDAVVHLLEFIPPDQLSIRPSTISHTVNVAEGQTLAQIAKQEYGDAKYVNILKSANNIRDPKKLPKVLNVPPLVGK